MTSADEMIKLSAVAAVAAMKAGRFTALAYAEALLARCAMQVRIPQPGGQESLNVAAAAAVCLYESARSVD